MKVTLYKKATISFQTSITSRRRVVQKPRSAITTNILQEFIEDPVKTLRNSKWKIELFSKQIDSFKYSDCVGHPKWFEIKSI